MAGTSSCPLITINASEVASAIGRNEWKTRDDTMQKVWKRTDYQTFCVGNALENEEEVIVIIDRHWKEASGENKEDFSQILFEDWDKQEDTLVKMLTEIFPESGFPQKSSFVPLHLEILDTILVKTDPDFRDNMLLKEAEVKSKDISQEVKKLSENERKPVSESVKEICEKKNIVKEETKRAVQSDLRKKRGNALEDKTIKHFEKENNVKVKQIPEVVFKKDLEYEGVKWRIQGRIDGKLVKEDQVVEVKNRTTRYYCHEYDKIQLQTYMFLCEKPKGLFLERLKGKQKEPTVFKFHESDWKEEVVPALKEFVSKLTSQIEAYRELLNFNKRYYVNIATTPPTSPSKRCNESSTNSSIKEKIPRM
jgi:hypothetical protein